MARGFSTKGVTTTDAIVTTDTDGVGGLTTWAIWAYAFSAGGGSLGKWMTVAGKTTTPGGDFAFGINTGSAANSVAFLMPNGSGESKWHITVANPPWTQYHHFCATMDFTATAHVPVMYYDGVSLSITTDAASTDITSICDTKPICIGNRTADSARVFDGYLADAAVWNVILTAAEVAALAQGAKPYKIRPSALKGWWPLDGLSSPEPDLSGRRNNGTLTGTAKAPGPPSTMFTPRWPQFNFPPPPPLVLLPQVML